MPPTTRGALHKTQDRHLGSNIQSLFEENSETASLFCQYYASPIEKLIKMQIQESSITSKTLIKCAYIILYTQMSFFILSGTENKSKLFNIATYYSF